MITPSTQLPITTKSKDSRVNAVGYIRLSTEKQAEGDIGFEKQADRIRKCCAKRGYQLQVIHEDTWSGVDPLGAVRRDGLAAAVKQARETGAILVIPEPTRLFRNVDAAKQFLKTLDVPVFSVRHGRFMKAPALLREIARGADAAQHISSGTSDALAQKKSEGVVFSTDAVRSKAARASVKSRALKSARITYDVARILLSDPAYRALSHKALADLLNRRGILSGWNIPWTQNSVRSIRKKAEALIRERAEIDANEDDDLVSDNEAASVGPATAVQRQVEALPEEPVDEESDMKKMPHFGMF